MAGRRGCSPLTGIDCGVDQKIVRFPGHKIRTVVETKLDEANHKGREQIIGMAGVSSRCQVHHISYHAKPIDSIMPS